jgi:hypothetical protein
MNITGAFICYKRSPTNDSRDSEDGCDLLLVFLSTVILDFGIHGRIFVGSKATYVF